jgi:hypothetical protein
VTDVQNLNLLLFFPNTVDDAVDIRLATVKQAPQPTVFLRYLTPVWKFFQAENGLLQS